MANLPSAKKNIRKSRQRQKRRRLLLQAVKKSLRDFRRQSSPEGYGKLQKTLDKAAKRGIFKKNKARRLKSRLHRRLQ